jgi:hypothetical protein
MAVTLLLVSIAQSRAFLDILEDTHMLEWQQFIKSKEISSVSIAVVLEAAVLTFCRVVV